MLAISSQNQALEANISEYREVAAMQAEEDVGSVRCIYDTASVQTVIASTDMVMATVPTSSTAEYLDIDELERRMLAISSQNQALEAKNAEYREVAAMEADDDDVSRQFNDAIASVQT